MAESCPGTGAERGDSGGGEVMEISLLRPDAVRLPPAGRGCALGLTGAAGFDCAEACCLAGDSDGDSKALISMADNIPDPENMDQDSKATKNDVPY